MGIPAGAVKSTYGESKYITDALSSIFSILEDHKTQQVNIDNDDEYTIKERKAAHERLKIQTLNRIEPQTRLIEQHWNNLLKDYKVPSTAASKSDIVTVMDLILKSEGWLTRDTLSAALEPVKNDPVALRTIHPVIQRTGLSEAFGGSYAANILFSCNKFEEAKKVAIQSYNALPSVYKYDSENSMKVALANQVFTDSLKALDNAYAEMKGAFDAE